VCEIDIAHIDSSIAGGAMGCVQSHKVFSVASIQEGQQQATESLWVQTVKECITLEVEYSLLG
jgi:hypothetical protein